MKKYYVIALVAFLYPAIANASLLRSDELMWHCEADRSSPKGASEFIYCAGYLSGVIDASAIMPLYGGKIPYCLPQNGVSNDQIIRLYVKWANAYPQSLHIPARSSVLWMLKRHFPCAE